MKIFTKFLFIALFFSMPFYSLAWGVLGHRIVGEIAWTYLTPKAKAAIQKILGDESMAMVANWPDFIKSDSTYRYLNAWHYINFKSDLSDADVRNYLAKDTATDVYTKLNFLVKELKKKNLAADKKAMYLKLVIHLVGDIHQPMHTGRPDDLGGNRVRVQWFGNATNLHAIWDETLINFQQLSYTEYTAAINHATAQQKTAWQKASIGDWILESYHIAETLYPEMTDKEQKLGYEYNFKHIKTVNDQLLKGGVRLAGLLNKIFG